MPRRTGPEDPSGPAGGSQAAKGIMMARVQIERPHAGVEYPSDCRKIRGVHKRRKAYFELVKRRRYQDSLDLRISAGISLTAAEIDELVALLGKRCKDRTRAQLADALDALPGFGNRGIFGRVLFEESGVSYCAGQSYPDEIRLVRQLVICRGAA